MEGRVAVLLPRLRYDFMGYFGFFTAFPLRSLWVSREYDLAALLATCRCVDQQNQTLPHWIKCHDHMNVAHISTLLLLPGSM